MPFVLLGIATVINLLLVAKFTRKAAVLATIHLLFFWTVTFLFEIAVMVVSPEPYDTTTFLTLLACLTGYTLLVGFLGQSRLVDDQSLRAFLAQPDRQAVAVLIVSLLYKVYLVAQYGADGLLLLSGWRGLGASYLEFAIYTLLNYLSMGVALTMAFRFGIHGWKTLRRPFLPVLTALWGVLSLSTGEVIMGGRRFVILLACTFAAALIGKIRWKHLAAFSIAGLLVWYSTEWYQGVRTNVRLEEVQAMLNERTPTALLAAIPLLVSPNLDTEVVLRENIAERNSQVPVLYEIVSEQFSRGTIAAGEVLQQAFTNTVPAIFVEDKVTRNLDEILALLYDFPPTDLAAGVLSALCAELSVFSFAVTPFLYIGLWAYLLLLLKRSKDTVLRYAFLGMLIMSAGAVEETLETFIQFGRDAFVLLLLAELLRFGRNVLRGNTRWPLQDVRQPSQ